MSGNLSYECNHLQAVPFLSPPGLICLNGTALDILVDEKRINPDTKVMYLKRKREADAWGYPLVNCMHHDVRDRFIFLSMWVGSVTY